jgi:hypothetical protein
MESHASAVALLNALLRSVVHLDDHWIFLFDINTRNQISAKISARISHPLFHLLVEQWM